ncbi:MAG: histidinol-phosphatase HisJ family protein [Coriobacteriales bacterium]
MTGFEKVPLIDCHCHTYLSGHGEGTVSEVADAAENVGVKVLAITEHMPLPHEVDPDCGFSMPIEMVDSYFDAIEQEAELHPGMTLLPGFEADWRPGCEDYLVGLSSRATVLLGSVHMLSDGWCFDDPDQISEWDVRGADAVWGEYFDLWMDAASSKVPFTTMSHPDLPKKFGFYPSEGFGLEKRQEDAAALCAERGLMVEVNTAGWRKPVGEQYPSLDFLRAFCRAGVDCTVGADAHSPSEVALGVREAYAVMYEAGYRRVAVPQPDGDRAYIPLVP